MADSEDADNIAKAIEHGRTTLGYDHLKPAQEEAIGNFLQGKDVFVSLPTGFGKSVIYELAPICTNFLATSNSKPALAVVISPLVSLMEDQMLRLESHGVKAVYLTAAATGQDGAVGNDTAVVFASPETILGPYGRKMINQHSDRIYGLFVDESHCIALWGQADDSGKLAAFRHQYGELAQLRSLLRSSIPVVSLTATATPRTRDIILQSLCMSNLKFVIESPNRSNIRYSFINIPEPDTDVLFEWLVTDLKNRGTETDRIIIYCGSRRQCTELYAYFEEELQDTTHFAMYHRMTPDSEKTRVVTSLATADGAVRVLFATIAFGMGIDVKAVHSIIHVALPKSEDCYFQESGRAGRDGAQSEAILLQHPNWRAGRVKVAATMKDYGSSTLSTCRRKHLLGVFGFEPEPMTLHLCCDICAKQCVCGDGECMESQMGKGKAEQQLAKIQQIVNATNSKLTIVRNINPESQRLLSEGLIEFRKTLLTDPELSSTGSGAALFTGEDVTSALPMEYITGIVDNAAKIANIDQLQHHFPLFNEQHKLKVWQIFTETIIVNASHDIIPDMSHLSLNTSDSLETSASESSDDSFDEVVRGTIASDSSAAESAESSDSN